MKYVGSKNRISKELAPIIQSYITDKTIGYLEPFVGGANMIDKIKHDNKIGYDIHNELIDLLKKAQDLSFKFEQHISEEKYNEVKFNRENFESWYVGFVGYMGAFSANFFTGYARSVKSDGITPRDMSNEAIRNLEKQRINLRGIKFDCKNFLDIKTNDYKNYVIYCDIPYKVVTKCYKHDNFPHEKFYNWAIEMSKNNVVLISEYEMPTDRFECIWEKKIKVGNSKNHVIHTERIERLFKVKP